MHSTPLNIAVFGAGSIGCYLGGLLASAGARVAFVGRERFQTQLKENGLTLTHYDRQPVHLPSSDIRFFTDTSQVYDSDIVLVTVKSQDSATAGRDLNNSVDKRALIISFQNGVGNAERLQEQMPGFAVLGGMVPFNVTSTGPGTFHCGTEGDLSVQSHDSDALKTMQVQFIQGGQGCVLSQDIAAVQWGKLLVNLNNAMNALTGGTLYEGLIQRDYRRALALMIEEALEVVQSAGITPEKFGKASPEKMLRILRLPNLPYRLIMNSIVKIDRSARSSMLDDLESGRLSEIDYLQGEIVGLAAKIGRPASINERVLKAVQQAFTAGHSPLMSGTDILKLVQSR